MAVLSIRLEHPRGEQLTVSSNRDFINMSHVARLFKSSKQYYTVTTCSVIMSERGSILCLTPLTIELLVLFASVPQFRQFSIYEYFVAPLSVGSC